MLFRSSIPDLNRSLELDSADADYARALKNDPSLVDAWRMRSRIALERQRREDAISFLKQGMEHNPEQTVLVADLANLYLLSRDSAAARPLVEQLLRAERERPEYLFSQARLLWLEGDYEAALESFRQLAAMRPAERRYAQSLIQSLVSMDDIPAALAELERWKDGEISGEMLALLTLARFDSAGLKAALDMIDDAVTRLPGHPYLCYLHGVLHTLSGYPAQARSSRSEERRVG